MTYCYTKTLKTIATIAIYCFCATQISWAIPQTTNLSTIRAVESGGADALPEQFEDIAMDVAEQLRNQSLRVATQREGNTIEVLIALQKPKDFPQGYKFNIGTAEEADGAKKPAYAMYEIDSGNPEIVVFAENLEAFQRRVIVYVKDQIQTCLDEAAAKVRTKTPLSDIAEVEGVPEVQNFQTLADVLEHESGRAAVEFFEAAARGRAAEAGAIIVADSHDFYKELCGNALVNIDGPLYVVSNGQEVLELLRKRGDISVVVTDLKMHEMGGEQLIAVMGKEFPNVPVIVATADQLESEYSKIVSILPKPYSAKDVKAAVQRALDYAASARRAAEAAVAKPKRSETDTAA